MQDMQDMIDRLNHSGKRLSKGHRRIAQYIVEHYELVYMNPDVRIYATGIK